MLEYIAPDNTSRTREYYEGIKNTTNNRTALKACIAALDHMKKTCNIKIVTNSAFIVNSINQNWSKTKNDDLWQQLLQRMSQLNVSFEYQLTNSYSTYMYMTAKKKEIIFEEDKQDV